MMKTILTLLLCLMISSTPALVKASIYGSKVVTLYNSGNFTGALYYINKVLTLNPYNVHMLLDKGIVLDDLGNHSGATIYYKKALSSPDTFFDNNSTLASKGVAADSLGDHLQAMKFFSQALKINPNDLYANDGMGSALISLKNYREAIY